ncbi:hypothetical protein VPH35_056053 [Triticum aestivum]|uniref:Uncharacterized protein n=2 Tax=Triticum TaxID=4564 RepID=A0A9R1QXQ8_TRITD|nr:unnamed protein product [Triticum aestivum]VAH85460.1 unnamed protein product [Triticum turgidum subsp. durum]
MPKLCHLEIGNMLIKTRVVVKIASECHDLKFLALHGCWDVDDKLLQEKYLGIKTLGPHVETAMRIASVRNLSILWRFRGAMSCTKSSLGYIAGCKAAAPRLAPMLWRHLARTKNPWTDFCESYTPLEI